MPRCLICVLRGNTFMTDVPIDQSGQGSATECRILHAPAEYCLARSHASFIARVRPLGTSSVSVPGGSVPSGSAGRSLRDYGGDYAQAPRENSAPSTSVREKQWADDRSDCDSRVGHVSRYSEKRWLSRAHRTGRFKFTLTMCLIDCTIRNSPRPMAFWCPFGNAPSGAV